MTEQEHRKFLIERIESLYPADADHDDTAAVGAACLSLAMKGVTPDWREMPLDILKVYATLAREYDEQIGTTVEMVESEMGIRDD